MIAVSGQVREAAWRLPVTLGCSDGARTRRCIRPADLRCSQCFGCEGLDLLQGDCHLVAHAATPAPPCGTAKGAKTDSMSSTYHLTKIRVPASINSEYGPGR